MEDKDQGRIGKRLQQLVDAATRVFSDVGYHAATVQEIANVAGVSVGLMYRYVPAKQELLFRCLRYIVERNRSGICRGPSDADCAVHDLDVSVESFFRAIVMNPGATQLLFRECGSLGRERSDALQNMTLETNALVVNRIDACVAEGMMGSVNAELLAYRIITVCHAWDLKDWSMIEPVSPDEYLATIVHSCWRPYLTSSGRRRLGVGMVGNVSSVVDSAAWTRGCAASNSVGE